MKNSEPKNSLQDLSSLTQSELSKFIGKPNTAATQEQMKNKITELLKEQIVNSINPQMVVHDINKSLSKEEIESLFSGPSAHAVIDPDGATVNVTTTDGVLTKELLDEFIHGIKHPPKTVGVKGTSKGASVFQQPFGLGVFNDKAIGKMDTASAWDSHHRVISKNIDEMNDDLVLNTLLTRNNRTASPEVRKKIMDVIYQMTEDWSAIRGEPTKILLFEDDPKDPMELLPVLLKRVNGIVDAKVMFNDYPDTVSLIVRMDIRRLNDQEIDNMHHLVQTILGDFKPNGLLNLEVIYHMTEVY